MDRFNPETQAAVFNPELAVRTEAPTILEFQKPERLPFTIRIVSAEEDLEKAVKMRRMAYARHLPEFAEKMTVENSDRAPGSVILLAESKLDDAPLGTMRIQTNKYAPLPMEQSVELPARLASSRLAEATRLGVAGGTIGRMVKIALCKALFMYCGKNEIDWMVITARAPLDREYEAMLFEDVFSDRKFIPMAHVGDLPHRVLAGEVGAARRRWEEARHPLFEFVFQTHHPDIELPSADLSFEPDTVRCPEVSHIMYGRE
jgi:hypothetical protein